MSPAARSILLMGLCAGIVPVAFGDAFTFTTVSDPLGTQLTFAFGINNVGQIVGMGQWRT
jgi:hypothetical protein